MLSFCDANMGLFDTKFPEVLHCKGIVGKVNVYVTFRRMLSCFLLLLLWKSVVL